MAGAWTGCERALISGLLPGINVFDTGSVHGILARFGVSYIKVDGVPLPDIGRTGKLSKHGLLGPVWILAAQG